MVHYTAIIFIFTYLIKYIDYSVPNISLFSFFEIITIEFFYFEVIGIISNRISKHYEKKMKRIPLTEEGMQFSTFYDYCHYMGKLLIYGHLKKGKLNCPIYGSLPSGTYVSNVSQKRML